MDRDIMLAAETARTMQRPMSASAMAANRVRLEPKRDDLL
jgi:hypothetical protein